MLVQATSTLFHLGEFGQSNSIGYKQEQSEVQMVLYAMCYKDSVVTLIFIKFNKLYMNRSEISFAKFKNHNLNA